MTSQGSKRMPGRRRRHIIVQRCVLGCVAAAWLLPTIGLLVTSFREKRSALGSGWWTAIARPFDSEWTMENYSRVLTDQGMGNAFVNTLVVVVPSTLIPMTLAAFAGYGFAWGRFAGRNVLFVLAFALMILPLQITFIPLLRLFARVDLQGSFVAVWLVHAGSSLPIAIYLMRNYMASLPRELLEAARVDGASHLGTFWRVVVPLSLPAIASYGIFQFLWTWNDYLIALVFLGTTTDREVATVNLAEMIGTRGQDWNLLTAGAFVTMVVPLLVFFSLQRYFVRGLTAGSVKG